MERRSRCFYFMCFRLLERISADTFSLSAIPIHPLLLAYEGFHNKAKIPV